MHSHQLFQSIKHEVIVPLSMAPLQKEVYRSILSESNTGFDRAELSLTSNPGQNLTLLESLARKLAESAKSETGKSNMKTNMNNILMQLRK